MSSVKQETIAEEPEQPAPGAHEPNQDNVQPAAPSDRPIAAPADSAASPPRRRVKPEPVDDDDDIEIIKVLSAEEKKREDALREEALKLKKQKEELASKNMIIMLRTDVVNQEIKNLAASQTLADRMAVLQAMKDGKAPPRARELTSGQVSLHIWNFSYYID